MSMFNLLNANVKCLHCKVDSEMEIELFFGDRQLKTYSLGDKYPIPENSLDLETSESVFGEGYAECSNCRACFYIIVEVKNQSLHGVVADTSRPIHLPN